MVQEKQSDRQQRLDNFLQAVEAAQKWLLRTWRAKLLVKFDKFALKASLTGAYSLIFSHLTQNAEIMSVMLAQQGFQSDFLTNSAR